jgi:hypothetical protein
VARAYRGETERKITPDHDRKKFLAENCSKMIIEVIRFESSWHWPRAEQDTQPFHKPELFTVFLHGDEFRSTIWLESEAFNPVRKNRTLREA